MCDKVLTMTQILSMSTFWIKRGSEYASGSEYVKSSGCTTVLNMSRWDRVLNMPK